jgi:hypothetical protein
MPVAVPAMLWFAWSGQRKHPGNKAAQMDIITPALREPLRVEKMIGSETTAREADSPTGSWNRIFPVPLTKYAKNVLRATMHT